MNIAGLLYILFAHFFCGRGILKLFRVRLPAADLFFLSLITGVPIISFVPCFIQLLTIPITLVSVTLGISILTCLLLLPQHMLRNRPEARKIKLPALYEWPYLLILFFLIVVSVWRCFYYPPISRDMLTGPELIAEYAVREHTMINSVFSVDLSTTNNYFKSPYITGLQIVYKLLVCPFGQLWLSVVFVSFTSWLYLLMRRHVHPVIGGAFMLFFICQPELYAYSFVILYDYSNAVFFFCGFYFLYRFWQNKKQATLFLSAFMFGIATYIRNETLILVFLTLPLLLLILYRLKTPVRARLYYLSVFGGASVLFYILCLHVFIRFFIPRPFDLGGQVNPHIADVSAFLKRFMDMNSGLIFSQWGISLYGYFIFLFIGILMLDICWTRRFRQASIVSLYGVFVVYLGLPLLGYLLPLFDLENTTKRGLFKILPLMFFYMCSSGSVRRISVLIRKWAMITPKTAGPATMTTDA